MRECTRVLPSLTSLPPYRNRDNKDKSIACTKELRAAVETALGCALLGASLVMAGTGDLDVLRVIRELRRRLDDYMFGSQMAISMCTGEYLCTVMV